MDGPIPSDIIICDRVYAQGLVANDCLRAAMSGLFTGDLPVSYMNHRPDYPYSLPQAYHYG